MLRVIQPGFTVDGVDCICGDIVVSTEGCTLEPIFILQDNVKLLRSVRKLHFNFNDKINELTCNRYK